MDSLDITVLRALRGWLMAGRDGWLCTVLSTFGSAPRPVGSLLACNESTGQEGSLSGGCVEEDLLDKIRSGALASYPSICDYGVSARQNERVALPCGGRMRVLVEKLSGTSDVNRLGIWLQWLDQRRIVRRQVAFDDGNWALDTVPEYFAPTLNATHFSQCCGPRKTLLLIGAGELARCVASLAQPLDYRVLVCDPRSSLIEQWPLAGVELLCCMPDDAVREHASDAHSVVLALTHDPRIDDMALMEALRSDAFYVGAIGSARTAEKRRQRLRQLDLDAEQIDRLHAPVGLAIGSRRPPEIAIAILAELIELQARSSSGALHGGEPDSCRLTVI